MNQNTNQKEDTKADNPLNDISISVNIGLDKYTYSCSFCGEKSTFDFSLAPVPILVK